MARDMSPLAMWSQYLAARTAVMGITCLDVRTNLHLAAAAGRGLFQVATKHRKRAIEHLRQAFPEWSDAQLESTAQQSFEYFAQLAIEVAYLPRLVHAGSVVTHCRIVDSDDGLALMNRREPTILVSGHFGNWEAPGLLFTAAGYKVSAVVRPLDNRLLNRWLLQQRERRGMRVIEKWADPLGHIASALAQRRAVGIIADQNAGDRGLFVPFFGRLASTHKSVALLAIKRNTPIMCGFGRRVGDDLFYEIKAIDVIHPADWRNHPDPQFYVTARFVRAIEMMAQQYPGHYLWMHRRWKSRPWWERKGKPVPDAVKRRLASLPWLDSTQLGQLIGD